MDNTTAVKEIIEFCETNSIDSYYDLSTYAYEQENENWIMVLKNKNTRTLIAAYLSDKHKKNRTKYKTSKCEAKITNVNAKAEYHSKKEREFFDLIDNAEENEGCE